MKYYIQTIYYQKSGTLLWAMKKDVNNTLLQCVMLKLKKKYNSKLYEIKEGKAYPIEYFNTFTGIVYFIEYSIWFKGGKPHKDDGPAFITKEKSNQEDQYFLRGKKYTLEEYWEKQKYSKYADKIFSELFSNKESEE